MVQVTVATKTGRQREDKLALAEEASCSARLSEEKALQLLTAQEAVLTKTNTQLRNSKHVIAHLEESARTLEEQVNNTNLLTSLQNIAAQAEEGQPQIDEEEMVEASELASSDSSDSSIFANMSLHLVATVDDSVTLLHDSADESDAAHHHELQRVFNDHDRTLIKASSPSHRTLDDLLFEDRDFVDRKAY
jgi:hypothetical protein